jgi:excisionase family DNA binding protein
MVEKRYVVAIDGAQKFTRTISFADEALHRQSGDQTTYVVYCLEAALVGPQGISIPLLAEFCENKVEDENQEISGEQAKQDCEASRLLCVPTMIVYRMIRDGRLHGYKIEGCMMKVDKHEVMKMIEASLA